MTAPGIPTVEHGTLTLGRQLGQGGQGTVYQVANKKINEAVGGGWDVVYKEYAAAVLPHLDPAALASRVALTGTLGAAEGRWLCEKTAWPAAVVQRHGRTCGFLMRAVPDRFRFTFRSLAGGTAGTQRLANLEYLLNDDSYVAGIGLTISDRDRLALLADLAATLTRLHRIGITVGDLSPKNLLFTTTPQPECFLIDCDAMRLHGSTVLPQAETPDWQVPAGEEKATRTSDIYKFALLAIRLLAREQTATDPAALAALSPELGALARTSLTADPARRPTPSLWAEQLTAAGATASAAPAAPSAARSRPPRRPSAPSAQRPGAGGPPRHTPPAGGTGTGGQPSGSGKAAVAVAAVIVAGILALTLPDSGSSSHNASGSSPQSPYSTYSTIGSGPGDGTESEYPTDEESDEPDPTPSEEDDEDTADPTYDTPDPDPTTYSPEPDPPSPPAPPPPPPRPDHYGAIAVGSNGSLGRAWDYRSRSAARQAALNRCPSSDCKVLTSFANGCGAVAYNRSANHYWGGHGATPAEAQRNAISHAGGGSAITWVCTTRYRS
ncbi:serine/threonine-protein kinase [Streptomyces sp. NBRC 110611]|uniref:DUF4189 domain-containing protein n=1 Tax=Streptomyces sp. NBRC 110611 TaxID=1621259 RepID=UPI0008299483|nr:DUF4189 domain-containing protein [Streptomyces sp. NBRC 110611]GAU65709.1 serine/threonine-protein kinase [Streptomyces sp. NBRC 110611]